MEESCKLRAQRHSRWLITLQCRVSSLSARVYGHSKKKSTRLFISSWMTSRLSWTKSKRTISLNWVSNYKLSRLWWLISRINSTAMLQTRSVCNSARNKSPLKSQPSKRPSLTNSMMRMKTQVEYWCSKRRLLGANLSKFRSRDCRVKKLREATIRWKQKAWTQNLRKQSIVSSSLCQS